MNEEQLRRAIWAVEAPPNRDRRFLGGLRSGAPALAMTARDVQAEFGLDAVIDRIDEEGKIAQERALRACPFVLTLRDHDDQRNHQILGRLRWLCDHRRHTLDARIVTGITLKTPIGKMVRQTGLHRTTIKRRYRRAMDLMAAHFWQDIVALS